VAEGAASAHGKIGIALKRTGDLKGSETEVRAAMAAYESTLLQDPNSCG